MLPVAFSRDQLWLLQEMMQLKAGLVADIDPFGRELALKLLRGLYRSALLETEGESVDIYLEPEEALTLAVLLKPKQRDASGRPPTKLILDCLAAYFEGDS